MNAIKYPTLPYASSIRGASMGRPTVRMDPDDNARLYFTLYKMPMEDDCYDTGGAYWGAGSPEHGDMWHAFTEHPELNETFVRARSREEAKALVLEVFRFAVFIDDEYPGMDMEDSDEVIRFVDAYAECALWSSTDDDGEPLDAEYGTGNLAPETRRWMVKDCMAFLTMATEGLGLALVPGWDAAQAGHDFWLTRNHHGAGFWDRYSSGHALHGIGRTLTNISQSFGESHLYVQADGDDGFIHHE